MSKLQLNLDAKPFISKKFGTSHASSLNTNAKPFIPKFLNKQTTTVPAPTPTPTPAEKPKPKKYKEYFLLDEDDKQTYKFDFDYMISFENWEICQETKLLSEEFLKQLEDFKIVELESIKTGGQGNKGKKVIIKLNQNKAKKRSY